MKLLKFAVGSMVALAVSMGVHSVSATTDPISLDLGSECADGTATHTITVTSQLAESQEIELEVWVNGVLVYTLDATLEAAPDAHDFVLNPMALDNVVQFIVSAGGQVVKTTDWLVPDDQCQFQDSELLLFIVGDSTCVDGSYEYTYTLFNEYAEQVTVDLEADVNGVLTQQQMIIPAGGSAPAGPIVIPTGNVPIVAVIDWYLNGGDSPYRQQGFSSSTGYPACEDGDGDSGAGLPDSGADSGTLALLAGALLLAGVMVTGVAATRRRSA